MQAHSEIVQSAEFNPKIKAYMFTYGAVLLLISFIGIPLLPFWILGLGQYISHSYYKNIKCNLTSKHLEFKKGMMFKVEKTIPLENIQDLTFIENPLLRIFDLRILKIETAGQSNPQGSDMKLVGIVNTQDFKDKVLEQRALLKNESKVEKVTEVSNDSQVVELLTEIKDLLKEMKNEK
ncbi:PH domain-containing protein [Flammeovirga yaeyamensis]|uniref:PH domain-containing protein n=1 Tax=Flammeovirga yaeyamensis TaxID=367791 RepID=A0AAX1NDL3_9BACT|nr:PH domain-containing protein [Flammeovirga yaeyamensis]MBB3699210.1 putative membrane protein [Flammeovirga yaeyamensis]NMF35526.1 PH domain-containing protein [Flammeovirga yaeyamensis]QWG04385.1 PH domain-containing protein [Flammeovirga yaeyamensis]